MPNFGSTTEALDAPAADDRAWALEAWDAGDPATIAATEAELLRRGFLRPGPWVGDGKKGSETIAAIRRFQYSIGAGHAYRDGHFGPRQWQRFWAS